MARSLMAALVAVVVLSACIAGPAGSGRPGSSSPGPSGPGGSPGATGEVAAGLLVKVTQVGGFVSPVELASRFPDIAIYQDGRVIQPVYLPTVYPGPLLPSVHQTMVTPAGLQRVLALAQTDGLTEHDQAYPARGVADASDTLITVVVNGRAVTSRVGALGAVGPVSDPTEAAARSEAQDFVAQLTGSSSLLASDQVGQPQQYVPDAVQIVAVEGDPSAGIQPSEMARQPLAWPLATPLTGFGSAVPGEPSGSATARCGVVTGADLTLLWLLLQAATQITGFASGGSTWTLTPRPLLPGEPGTCVPA